MQGTSGQGTRDNSFARRLARQTPADALGQGEKGYVFDGSDGRCTLIDLFGDRSQLAIYHFMLTPGSDHLCLGCSYTMGHVDAARQHFEQADLAFAAISRAPIKQVKARMGWTFP